MRFQTGYKGIIRFSLRVRTAIDQPELTARRAHSAHVAHEAGGGGRLRGRPLQGRGVGGGREALVAGTGEGQRRRWEEGGGPRAEVVHSLVRGLAAHLRQEK